MLADLADLRVGGVRVADYGTSVFSYDAASNTATWTLARPLNVADRVALDLNADAATGGVTDSFGNALDGEWSDGVSAFPSGNTAPGGNLHFSLSVLPGDGDRSGRVDAFDVLLTRLTLLRTAASPGLGTRRYAPFFDFNGDGMILSGDFVALRTRLGTKLPPSAGSLQAAATPTFDGSFTRDDGAAVGLVALLD